MKTEKELQLLKVKEEYIMNKIQDVLEYAHNSEQIDFLGKELDFIKSQICKNETLAYFSELEKESAED
jgi:hypothetical protein